jgi:molecular chaperone DnaK (HSP70)
MFDHIALILALEPEAASLCCRQNKKELKFEKGTIYMVVDNGGGTVDIAVHEIDESGISFTNSLV